MAQFFINLDDNSPERFAESKFMEIVVDNSDPLTSYFYDKIKALPPSGSYSVQHEVERPESLSYSIYGDSQYWWILLEYNGIKEYSQIAIGDTILYPSIADIEDLFFALKSLQTAAEA